jgi:hypothetical protein
MKALNKKIVDFLLFRTFIIEKFFILGFILSLVILTLSLVFPFKNNPSILLEKSTPGQFKNFLLYFGMLIIYRLYLEQNIVYFKFYKSGKRIAKKLNINLAEKFNKIDKSTLIACKKNWKNFFNFDLFFAPLIFPILFIVLAITVIYYPVNNNYSILDFEYGLLAIIKTLPKNIFKHKITIFIIKIIKILNIRIFLELQTIYIRTMQTAKLIAQKTKSSQNKEKSSV